MGINFFKRNDRDAKFVLFEHIGVDKLLEYEPYQDFTPEDFNMIIDEALKVCTDFLGPALQDGDRIGAQFSDGEVTLLTDELSRPNGIAMSPDERTLYVANSDPERAVWMAYDLLPSGRVENGRVFFDATGLAVERPGLPDGLKVDAAGNLFATGPGGVLVLSSEGRHLGTILTTFATANCAFDRSGATLYMTADSHLLRIRLRYARFNLGVGC